MKTIKSLYAAAYSFKEKNPEIGLTMYQICQLAAAGVKMDNHNQSRSDSVGRVSVLLAAQSKPFTAGDIAKELYRVDRPTRRQCLNAARILRDELGLEPRKSNGRLVYDPPE